MIKQTSLASHADLVRNGTLGKLQLLAWTVLQQSRNGLTGAEVERAGGKSGLWKRLSELKKLGVIQESEVRECSITGRMALTWKISTPIPVPQISKRKTRDRRRWFLVHAGHPDAANDFVEVWGNKPDREFLDKHYSPGKVFEVIEVREVMRS